MAAQSRFPRFTCALVVLAACVSQSRYEREDVTLDRIDLRNDWLQTAASFGLVIGLGLLLLVLYRRRTRARALDGLFKPRRARDGVTAVHAWWSTQRAGAFRRRRPTLPARWRPAVALLGTVIAGTIAGGVGLHLVPLANEAFYLLMYHRLSPLVDEIQRHHILLRVFVSVRPFYYAAAYATILAGVLMCSERAREVTIRARGVLATAIVYGTLVWLANVGFARLATSDRATFALFGWFADAVLLAAPVVWSVARLAARAVPRDGRRASAALPRRSSDDERHMLQIAIGAVIAVPAALGLHYMLTDPSAGFFMIVGVFIEIAEAGALPVAAGLVLGGVWGLCGWRGRRIVTAVPVALGLGVVGFPLLLVLSK